MTSVDCHDGDIEPVVHHRKTLTSRVAARDILRAIKKYAFITSAYPVIISAEVHCSVEQQIKLNEILRETLCEALVTAPLKERGDLPSLEDLKYRVLFKVGSPLRHSLMPD